MIQLTTTETLKEWGLKDDEILSIAIERRLLDSIKLLREFSKRAKLDTPTCLRICKDLKEELNS